MLGPTADGATGVALAGPGTTVVGAASGVAQPGSLHAGAGVT
jgi:hypothetical protein